jgi:putative alpha-1,2-mannosidase
MVRSLILKYEQGGWLPIFPCWNSYTSAMIGDHGISVIGDAFVKGVRNFDIEKRMKGCGKMHLNRLYIYGGLQKRDGTTRPEILSSV